MIDLRGLPVIVTKYGHCLLCTGVLMPPYDSVKLCPDHKDKLAVALTLTGTTFDDEGPKEVQVQVT